MRVDHGSQPIAQPNEWVRFIAYLRVKEELEATKEIISDRDFLKSIMAGDEDFRAGRFKKWSAVKEDV